MTHMRRSKGITTETARETNGRKKKRRTDKGQTHTRRREETITDTDRDEERDRIGKETNLLHMKRRKEVVIEFNTREGKKRDKATYRVIQYEKKTRDSD